jgi:hypothetical protein
MSECVLEFGIILTEEPVNIGTFARSVWNGEDVPLIETRRHWWTAWDVSRVRTYRNEVAHILYQPTTVIAMSFLCNLFIHLYTCTSVFKIMFFYIFRHNFIFHK